jgi:hypothetical protein
MEKKQLVYQFKWQEREAEFEHFKTMLESRNNIFMFGANGTGKTTFV